MPANSQDEQVLEDDAGPLEQSVPVADESIEDADNATVEDAPLSPEDALIAEFVYFKELLAEGNYDAADASAKRIVEMAIRTHGPQSLETSKALSNLGLVQHNNKQYDAAIQNFTASIEIIETVEDRLNEQLVNPLMGLGAAQLGSGRPDLAVESFTRAAHITHVNEGPHNVEQIEILESLAESYVRAGDIETARDILDRIHALNVRYFEDDALGLLPSLMRRAEWQHRAGYHNDERATYRRTIRIIETSAGKDDPRLIEPLVKLGETFYFYDPVPVDNSRSMTAGSGEAYFKRAVGIAEGDGDNSWLEVATTKLALADYYAFTDSHNRARKIYLEVWNDLSTDDDRLAARRDLLERPILLREGPLPSYPEGSAAASSGAALKGTIRVEYTISARGNVKSIRTEASPVEFTDMQRVVHREVRGRFFRPPMVDGEPTEAPDQVFVHEFSYLQGELDELKAAATKEPDEAS
jgi:tetratricopeptide (TPR) repeat protein